MSQFPSMPLPGFFSYKSFSFFLLHFDWWSMCFFPISSFISSTNFFIFLWTTLIVHIYFLMESCESLAFKMGFWTSKLILRQLNDSEHPNRTLFKWGLDSSRDLKWIFLTLGSLHEGSSWCNQQNLQLILRIFKLIYSLFYELLILLQWIGKVSNNFHPNKIIFIYSEYLFIF